MKTAENGRFQLSPCRIVVFINVNNMASKWPKPASVSSNRQRLIRLDLDDSEILLYSVIGH